MGSNEHEHGSHYHGEPSRVLDDDALPELVVLYRHGFPPGEPKSSPPDDEDEEFWATFWRGVPEVKKMAGSPLEEDESGEDLTRLSFPPERIDPFHPDFEGFLPPVTTAPSVLFVPARLRISPGTVEDLKSNDVSVNWLALDPEEDPGPLPGAMVLSDWITRVDPDLPRARSTGVAPGIVHLRAESLERLGATGFRPGDFAGTIQDLIEHPETKVRPALFHNREWSIAPRN